MRSRNLPHKDRILERPMSVHVCERHRASHRGSIDEGIFNMSFLSPLSRRRPSVRPSLFLQPRLKLFDHQLILPARARPLPRPPPPPPPLPCKGAAKSEEDYDSKSRLRIGALSQPRMRIAVASSSKEPSRLPTEPGARERACHLKHVVIGIATTRTTDICD